MMTSEEMLAAEDYAEQHGVSRAQLMNNAGLESFVILEEEYALEGKSILVMAYHGNNGGDGFALANHLKHASKVHVLFLGQLEKLKEEAKEQFDRLDPSLILDDMEKINIDDYDLIIDALLGSGVKGTLSDELIKAVDMMNQCPKPVISLDIPTGIDPDRGKLGPHFVKANIIITFHDLKPGLSEFEDHTIIADIGIPPIIHASGEEEKHYVGDEMVRRMFSTRKRNAHKGDYGRVLILAGSETYPGAAYLAAGAGLAALRGGTDLVTVASAEHVAKSINALNPDLITIKLDGKVIGLEHYDILLPHLEKADVILMGPGIGEEDSTSKLIRKICEEWQDKQKVIDADALKMITLHEVSSAILTPHQGELKILLDHSNLRQAEMDKGLGTNVMLIKGDEDEILTATGSMWNRTGNPGMTVGGTGDLLAGLCAGLLAANQGKHARFLVACVASYILGHAGDQLKKEYGDEFIASDFLAQLGKSIKSFSAD